MFASNFVLENYLDRIGFTGTPKADAETLKKIMQSQLRTVPFENLDVQAGKIVSMVPEEIVDKIVHKQRGGYCYEVNGLFAMAMQALGIQFKLLGARPMFYPTRRPKTHMVILASVDGQDWLCDVGFGSYGINQPLNLNTIGTEVKQGFDTFTVQKLDEKDFVLKALVDNEWANQYSFDLYAHDFIDFMPANYMNSTHPDSVFVQKPLIVVHTENGRKILFGDSLKIVSESGTEQQQVTADKLSDILKREFNLEQPQ